MHAAWKNLMRDHKMCVLSYYIWFLDFDAPETLPFVFLCRAQKNLCGKNELKKNHQNI